MNIIRRYLPATDPRVRTAFKALVKQFHPKFIRCKSWINWWSCMIIFNPDTYINTTPVLNWLSSNNFDRRYGIAWCKDCKSIYMVGCAVPEPDIEEIELIPMSEEDWAAWYLRHPDRLDDRGDSMTKESTAETTA